MGKIIEIFFGLIFVILLLVAGGIGVAYHYRSEFIKAGIEKIATQALKTPVSFGDTEFDSDKGYFSVRDINIKNPNGFSDRNALTFGEITLIKNQEASTDDTYWIKEFTLRNINILYEYDEENGKSNLAALTGSSSNKKTTRSKKTKMSESRNAPDKEEEDDDDEPNGTKIRMDEFNFQSVKITVIVDGREFSIPLPDIVVHDVGNGESLPPDEFLGGIIKNIPDKTWKEINNAKEALKNAGAKNAAEALETLSDLQNANSVLDTLLSRLDREED